MVRSLPYGTLLFLVACEGVFGSPRASLVTSNAARSAAEGASHIAIHRLTNDEYTNTAQDLLRTASRPGDLFPRSSVGESGFKNDSTALGVSEEWVSRAYTAADTLATELIASKGTPGGAYEALATCPSGTADCASEVITKLATRAYRRPIREEEHAQLMNAFKGSFDEGLHDAVVAMLLSPSFLFVVAEDEGQISDFVLASRLSYFLWQTMPDDELFAAASSGALSTRPGIEAQVARMLADPRAARLASTLVREWAGLANLESSGIDGLSDTLRAAMIKETDVFVQDLIKSDGSLMNLVSSNYSFVNKALADLYGVPFPGTDPNAFVRVDLTGAKRMGVGTQASVLTATAGAPQVTHPVRRGFWVAQRVLCMAPPPPPMNVPPLDPGAGAESIRDRLNQHVASPACSGCHVVMDALGLGLENYDPSGRWRDSYASGMSIDASGVLPSGATFATPEAMYAALASEDQVRACLAKQMMGLAFTRSIKGSSDLTLAKTIGDTHLLPSGTFSGLITDIVSSAQFRQQVPEAN